MYLKNSVVFHNVMPFDFADDYMDDDDIKLPWSE